MATTPKKLPALDDHPAADVVIYDGHCRFCTEQVRRLTRWDGRGRLAFLSLHDEQAARLCPDLTHRESRYVRAGEFSASPLLPA